MSDSADIINFKELERFLKICRKQGVDEITYAGISVKFGNLPAQKVSSEESEIPSDDISPDELMFYHLQGSK